MISRICVTIIDQQCELTTDILVCEFWSIEDVLGVYLQSSRREKHKNATLSFNNEVLDLQSTVYDEKIENQNTLYYLVGKYTVLVYDSEINNTGYSLNHGGNGNTDQPCLEIEVMDNQVSGFSNLSRQQNLINCSHRNSEHRRDSRDVRSIDKEAVYEE